MNEYIPKHITALQADVPSRPISYAVLIEWTLIFAKIPSQCTDAANARTPEIVQKVHVASWSVRYGSRHDGCLLPMRPSSCA